MFRIETKQKIERSVDQLAYKGKASKERVRERKRARSYVSEVCPYRESLSYETALECGLRTSFCER